MVTKMKHKNFKQHQTNIKSGFTLVELSFAIVFISVLLMTIAIVTSRIISVYQKGNTVKEINEVGRELIDDFSGSIADASSLNKNNLADIFITFTHKDSRTNSEVQSGGVFCTGKYSFIWNTGYSLSLGESDSNRISYNGDSQIHLIKVEDTSRSACASAKKDGRRISSSSSEEELLKDSRLALYNFHVYLTQDNTTFYSFYSSSFILASSLDTKNIDVVSGNNFCKNNAGSSSSLDTDFNYCALNKFNFAVRATGV